jgi:hypothetical protein
MATSTTIAIRRRSAITLHPRAASAAAPVSSETFGRDQRFLTAARASLLRCAGVIDAMRAPSIIAYRSPLYAPGTLAHLVLHKHGGPQQGRDAEMEANNFASSFLMPKADVRSRLPFVSRLDELVVAKKRWAS